MAFDISTIPNELIDSYRRKKCIAFVGAGASMGAGLPSWKDLLLDLVRRGQSQQVITDASAEEYNALAENPQKFLTVASGVKADLGKHFDECIDDIFLKDERKPTVVHEQLVSLDKLAGVITINYDTLIETAYRERGQRNVPVLTYKDLGTLHMKIHRNQFFILKAHGDAMKAAEGIILTKQDYRKIIMEERGYQAFLTSIFMSHTILFIGCSMIDPELNLILDFVASLFKPNSGPVHYALMPSEELTKVEESRWFTDLGIQAIKVKKANGFSEVPEFLVGLLERAAA